MNLDVKAINQAAIPNAQRAIQNYVSRVQKITNQISGETNQVNYLQGIRGTAQETAIITFIQEAVTRLQSITSQMLQFDAALGAVSVNYMAQSEAIQGGTVAESGQKVVTGVSGFDA